VIATASRCRGVTLIEMSIVLVILGVLLQAAIAPLAGSRELRRMSLVKEELELIKQSLISHLLLYGALPCPLGSEASGAECLRSDGQIPSVALGLVGSLDESNALLDPWGRPYQYVIGSSAPDWTSPQDYLQTPISDWQASLELCKRAESSGCSRRNLRADSIVFVVFSLGADPDVSGDQAENLDGDTVFSVRTESIEVGEEYDDHIIWATQSEFLYWLLRAGVMG